MISRGRQTIFTKTNEISEKVTKSLDTGSNYYAFGGFLIVGCLFLLLALTYLPFIFLAPNKFNLMFSLGSLFIQLSLAFFHGPLNYIKILFKKENISISLIYLLSLGMAFYSSMVWGTYLSALLMVII